MLPSSPGCHHLILDTTLTENSVCTFEILSRMPYCLVLTGLPDQQGRVSNPGSTCGGLRDLSTLPRSSSQV